MKFYYHLQFKFHYPLKKVKLYSIHKLIKKKQLGKAWKSIAGMLERGDGDDQLTVAKEAIESSFASRFKSAMASLDSFRSSVGAAALGFARRALDEALARGTTRIAFGQPIAEFQLIQAKLADMATGIDASALLVYRSAWTKDVLKRRVTRESSMAKMYATEAAQQVIDQAVQIFGGLGVVSGNPVEVLYREIRALRIYEGTTEINKLVIARQTLDAWREAMAAREAD